MYKNLVDKLLKFVPFSVDHMLEVRWDLRSVLLYSVYFYFRLIYAVNIVNAL